MTRRHTLRTIARQTTWLLAGVVIAALTAVAGLFLSVSSFPWEWARSVLAMELTLMIGLVIGQPWLV